MIHESHSFRDVLKFIKHDSWLLLDLDNTVMESRAELGSDQWFVNLMCLASQRPLDSKEACEWVIDIYHAVQHFVRAALVEEDIQWILQSLRDIGIPILAITARDHCLLKPTLRQLDEAGISFSGVGSECFDGSIYLADEKPFVYDHGIIFCSGGDKGKCLQAFLEECELHPKHIVMMDDKQKHLEKVETVSKIKKIQFDFDGIRYGYLDEKVKSIDMQKAHEQLAAIKYLLPTEVKEAVDQLLELPEEKYSIDEEAFFISENQEAKMTVMHLAHIHAECTFFRCQNPRIPFKLEAILPNDNSQTRLDH